MYTLMHYELCRTNNNMRFVMLLLLVYAAVFFVLCIRLTFVAIYTKIVMYKLNIIRALSTNSIRLRFQPQSIRYLSASATIMSRIIDAIKKDHSELKQYYNNIINAKSNDEATRWQNQFTWELARHSIAEELVVYPAFEKLLG